MRSSMIGKEVSRWVYPSVVVLLITLQLVLILWFPQLPTGDGPPHKYSAWVYRELTEDPSGPLARFFEKRDSWLYPNAAYSWYLVQAQGWLTLDQAERLGCVFYLLGLVLAFRYLIRSFGDPSWVPLLLLQTLTLNYLFFMGFFNFLWGVPFALVSVGSAQRLARDRRWLDVLVCNVALLSAFWCHLVSFALALFCVLIVTVLAGHRDLVMRVGAWLPASLMALVFWPRSAEVLSDWRYLDGISDRLWRILSYRVATSFGGVEVVVSAAFGLLLLLGACSWAWRHHTDSSVRTLAVLSSLLLILAVAVPRGAGTGFYLDDRVSLFFWLMTIVLIGYRRTRLDWPMALLSVMMVLAHLGILAGVIGRFNRQHEIFISGVDYIPKGSPVFVYRDFEEETPGVVRLWQSAQSRYSLALKSPDFHHFHAEPRHSGHFPIRYTPASLGYYPGELPATRVRPMTVSRFAPYVVFWDELPALESIVRERFGYRSLFDRESLQVYEHPGKALQTRLELLQQQPGMDASDRLLRWIRGTDGLGLKTFVPERALAANLSASGWVLGTGPVAILLINDTDEPLTFQARLRPHRDRDKLPLTLFLQVGSQIRTTKFEKPRARIVSLQPVAPNHEELILIWTDSCSALASSGRKCLGVRLLDIEVRGPKREVLTLPHPTGDVPASEG